ncbi:hypothetical protein B9Q04_08270 [Candidatus Marsarchaeota G2 archaeon BE_D]|jgi:ABC-type dipeptide transport system, periplasmic component|uniref:Solute-binding protein family 5 domain-containing protein n=1 Tax=Candidatus Marsarchaeota G2 archaeon BE_D TaxID=1978158 RepID=A0A2R6CAJ7_9ARCH|nr:MAG: hypothetical protein B9Q04_08270 [Candidatus Marsarchaeota G2 archaeon BE_D]
MLTNKRRKGVNRTLAVVLVVVVVIVIAASVYAVSRPSKTSTTPPTSTTSSSTTSTGSGSSTTTTSTSAGAPYNETLVVAETLGEPSGLDVAWSTDAPAYEIEQNIYQGLVWYQGNSTNSYVGVLATNWSVTPDGLTYTFSLRHDVRFSNGAPFNAYDVWFNYYRLTLNNGPPGYILGPATFTPGNITLQDLNTFNFTDPTPAQLAVMENPNQSIQVVNEYTIAFHLAHPIPSFMARLAAPPGGIEYPQFIQEHGGVQANGTENTYVDANGAPGTGPYVVSSWIHGQSITLTLNPYYWGPRPHVSKVVIEYVTNTLDAINDLKSGSAQMLYTVPFNLLPDINSTPGVILESHGLSYDIAWLSLNTQAYPLNITDVRLAINYAVNRTQIIDKVLYGYGVPFQGPIPIGMFGHNNSIMPIGYNLSKAKQLLAEAGFPGGKGIPPLTLLYYTGDPVVLATVQIIQSDLAQIGITVTLEGVTQATYFNIAATVPRVSNYPDILWSVWFPDFAYPDDYAYSFENINSVFDNSNVNNTLLNLWTTEALNSANLTQQAILYSKITELDKQLGDNVWLWQSVVGYGVPAYASNVHNVYWNPILYGYNYSAIYIYPYS